MKVVILAGGKGVRLGEKYKKIPKPFVKINNYSIAENLINLFINKCVYYNLPAYLAHQSGLTALAEDESIFCGLCDLVWSKVFR